MLAIEPVLDDRKDIAQLFQIKNYNLSFVENFKDAAQFLKGTIPHIIVVNIDLKGKNLTENVQRFANALPDETLKFCISKDKNSKLAKYATKVGYQEVFDKPIKGMIVFERLKFFLKDLKPLSANLVNRKGVMMKMGAYIVGLSETDFIFESGVKPTIGLKVNIDCPLVEKVLGEKKTYKVAENKHDTISSGYRYSTVTMLGLKNEDLQNIRAKILQWDKF